MVHFLKRFVDCIVSCFSQLDEFAVVLESFVWWLYCTLGQCIRGIRIASGLSQEGFAELVGVDVRTIQRWEVDQQVPRKRMLYQLQKLCDALEMDLILKREFHRYIEMEYQTYLACMIGKNGR